MKVENLLQSALMTDEHLPSPLELRQLIPLTPSQKESILHARETIQSILDGRDPRRLIIAGPCSIHNLNSAREYAHRYRQLQEEVKESLFLVMRAYFEKPRTIVGWKGMLLDPDLDGSHNLTKGLRMTRQLLCELAELGVPAGSELLELTTSHYYSDCLAWGCIGARTSHSPPHRQLAANLPCPVGFKNPRDGHIESAVQAVQSAQSVHIFLGISESGELVRMHAPGNPYSHIVLRGGYSGTNYSCESVAKAYKMCQHAKLDKRLLIDCSHDNCGKKPLEQINAFEAVIHQIISGNQYIGGMMLESHLKWGAQPISNSPTQDLSVTDPCLDWETTAALIRKAHIRLQATALCTI